MVYQQYIRARQCGKKRRHPSREEACKHAIEAYLEGQGLMNVYLCPWCRSWHCGH